MPWLISSRDRALGTATSAVSADPPNTSRPTFTTKCRSTPTTLHALDQVQSQGQAGASVPDFEARLRIYQGALSRLEEESRVAVRGLRAGELVPTPQPVGPSRGVVSLEAGKRLPETG